MKLETPPLGNIFAFKGVHALCLLSADNRALTPHYFACCLAFGSNPIWGLWDKQGRFVRFHGGRTEIENTYPYLVWRRIMARWEMVDLSKENEDLKKRIRWLEDNYGPVPKRNHEGNDG